MSGSCCRGFGGASPTYSAPALLLQVPLEALLHSDSYLLFPQQLCLYNSKQHSTFSGNIDHTDHSDHIDHTDRTDHTDYINHIEL